MSETAREEAAVPSERNNSARSRGSKVARRFVRFLVMIAGAAVFALVIGFISFAEKIAAAAPPADPHAQGIVVLTGGTARIDGALQLLAEGHADRLLISGVNPVVTLAALSSKVDKNLRGILDCCVDLGREARDTIGNAAETRAWADGRGFSSLIVVTSGYHMPRSMTELAQAMPDKELIPFPVNNPELHLSRWWRDPDTFSLLIREYGKFLLAETRQMMAGAEPTADGAAVAAVPR
jgi:uncharacterized SAM-binding protein YcdF (DUF218 family)